MEVERLLELGRTELEQSRYAEARKCYEGAVEIFRTQADRKGEGQVLGLLGNVYQFQGQYDEAIAHYTQAIAITQEVGDKRNAGIHLGHLGNVYLNQGQLESAIAPFTQSLAIAREVGDKLQEGIRLGNLGNVYQNEGQYDEAIIHYTLSLAIAREIGDKCNEGIHLGHLGDMLVKLNRFDEAETAFREAIPIGDQNFRVAAGAFRGSLALLLAQKGQMDEAQALFETGEPQVESHPKEHAKFLYKKGQVCHIAGDAEGARAALMQAQGMAAELKVTDDSEVGQAVAELAALLVAEAVVETPAADASEEERELALLEAERLMELGRIERGESRYTEARQCFEAALEIFRTHENRAGDGRASGNLGNIYRDQGQYEKAIEHFYQALAIVRDIGDQQSVGLCLGNLGDALVQLDRLSEAETALREGIAIGDETLPAAADAFRGSLALLLAQRDQIEEAQALLEVGEPRVENYPDEHAKFLCKKGRVCLFAGDAEGAQAALVQAQEIAAELKVTDDSEVGQAVAALAVLLGESDPDGSSETRTEDVSVEARELALIEAERLLELGRIELDQSRYTEGLKCFQTTLEIFRAHANRAGEGQALGGLGNAYKVQGQYDDAIEHYTEALAIAREIGDKHSEGIHLGNLGNVYEAQGQNDKVIAHYTDSLAIAREIGDKRSQGKGLGRLGNVYQDQGQYDDAIVHYSQSITIAREIGDKASEGIYLGNLGNVYLAQGQYDDAIVHYTQSIAIAREIGNKGSEGLSLGNLGIVYHSQGQSDKAIVHFTQSIAIAREIGYKRSECINLGNLGNALSKLNRLDEAETAFREAIPIGDETILAAAGAFRGSLALLLAQKGQMDEVQALLETGELQVESHPVQHAKFLCKKGQVCHIAGDAEGVRTALMQAQEMAAELKIEDNSELGRAVAALVAASAGTVPLDSCGPETEGAVEADSHAGWDLSLIEGARLMELGRIEYEQNRWEKARKCFQAVLEIYRNHEDRGLEGVALGGLGNVERAQGQYEAAEAHYRQAIQAFRETGNRRAEGNQLGNLGSVYREQQQVERAIAQYQQAVGIAHEIGNFRSEGIFTGNIGLCYQRQGLFERAVEYHCRALELHREVGDKKGQAIHLGNLGDSFFQMGRVDDAEMAFRESIPLANAISPHIAGAFRGSLALLLAQQRKFDESKAMLSTGESQVESHPAEHAKFLCKKGQVCLLAGDAEGARAALVQAQGMAQELKVSEDTELGRAVAELAVLLGKSDPGGDGSAGEASEEERELALTEAERLLELGSIEFEQGRQTEAQECYERALRLFRTHADRAGEGRAVASLGLVFQEHGQQDQAIAHYNQAMSVAQECGNKQLEGRILSRLGSVYRQQGANEKASTHYRQAIAMARHFGDRRYEGILLGSLANVDKDQGDYDSAIAHYSQSIAIAREIGDKRTELIHLGNLGTICQIQGQNERAMEHYRQSIAIAREIGDQRFAAISLGNLAETLRQQNRPDEAEPIFREAILVCDQFMPAAAGAFRGSLALLLAEQKSFDEISSLLKMGESQVESYRHEYAKFLCKKGQVFHLSGDADGARVSLVQVQEIAAALNVSDTSEVGQAVRTLVALVEMDSDGNGT